MALTPYAETECLLAVLNDDPALAAEIAGRMTAREQDEFVRRLDATIAVVANTDPEVL